MNAHIRGLFFEDFSVEQTLRTAGRTITEADLVNFAGISGDWTALHTDAEYAAQSPFGQRVAHGTLGLVFATALAVRTGFLDGTLLAFREIAGWVFRKPIFIGDTIYAQISVREIRAVPPSGGGLVTFAVEVRNQRDETVQQGTWRALVKSRASEAS